MGPEKIDPGRIKDPLEKLKTMNAPKSPYHHTKYGPTFFVLVFGEENILSCSKELTLSASHSGDGAL